MLKKFETWGRLDSCVICSIDALRYSPLSRHSSTIAPDRPPVPRCYSTASSSVILFNNPFSPINLSGGVRTRNPFSPKSLDTDESLDVLSRCSLKTGVGNDSFDNPRSEVGREEGGEVAPLDVDVRVRKVFSPVRGVDADMILV